MRTYLDSSALVPVYVNERFSRAARSVVRTAGQIPFTAIHQLEIPNAFELLVGRKLITRDECLALQAQLQDDLDNQRLMPVSLELVSFAKIATVVGQIAVNPERRRDEDDSRNRRTLDCDRAFCRCGPTRPPQGVRSRAHLRLRVARSDGVIRRLRGRRPPRLR